MSNKRISMAIAKSSIHGTRLVGIRFGPVGGAKKESVAVRVAVQVGIAAPDTAVQVCLAPSAVLPFINCTVPVGLAPAPVPTTFAVKVTLPPPAGRVEVEGVTVVVVLMPLTVTVTPGDVVEVA